MIQLLYISLELMCDSNTGCTLCDNEPCFERGEPVPLPPLPPVATIKKCPQKNHHKCYTKSLKSNEMFAHSVEALVVWIVESEEECSFEEFVAQKLPSSLPVGNAGSECFCKMTCYVSFNFVLP